MKKLFRLIKAFSFKGFFIDLAGFFKSFWAYLFRSIQKPAVVYGFGHFAIAKMICKKRMRKWKPEWDQLGKQQGILPIAELKLLVCSPGELKQLQKNGVINDERNYTKYFKHSYFKTKKQ